MKKILFSAIVLISISMLTITSCVKQKFDAPPDASNIDPNLTVNSSIWYLKNTLYTGQPTLIDTDLTISGIVIADDRSGNFYKQIVIQDTSSGIAVLLGRNSLYTDYPIGRKIYIKCKGLYIGEYNGFVQLGYLPDNSNSLSDIPTNLITKYVVKANYPNVVAPRIIPITQIKTLNASNKKWIGTLIQFDSVEVTQAQAGGPYAQDASISSGTDRTVMDCAGTSIIMRNSGYSLFRNYPMPTGKGSMTSIMSVYGSTVQMLLRDTSDLKMYAPRCNGSVISPSQDISIDSLRKLFNGTGIMLGNYKIHGVVSSSFKDSNISKGSLYLQDESGRGINIYYGGTIAYKLGDSLSIDVSGDSLILYKGLLEIDKASAKTTLVGSNKTINPVTVTIQDLIQDLNNTSVKSRIYESRLVKIVGCTITGATTSYNGSKTITDATGNMVMYCRNSPPYTTTTFPTSPVNITAIASIFNTPQVLIRSLADVTP